MSGRDKTQLKGKKAQGAHKGSTKNGERLVKKCYGGLDIAFTCNKTVYI